MRYLPLTEIEKKKILDLCQVNEFSDLVTSIPEELRLKTQLDLEPALCEAELKSHIQELANNIQAHGMQSHLGQGVYDHSWPSVIDQITNRGEFLTAYTPINPNFSRDPSNDI